MKSLLALALLASSTLVACEETGDCDALDPKDAWVEVGAGEASFESIDSGHTFAVERGSQGGMHIWTSVRAADIAPGSADLWDGLRNGDLPIVRVQLEGPNGLLTTDDGRPTVLERGDGEFLLLHQLTVFRHFEELPDDWQDLDFGEVEVDMEAQDHTLSVTIEDRCGTTVEDAVTVRVDFPERTGDDDDDDSGL